MIQDLMRLRGQIEEEILLALPDGGGLLLEVRVNPVMKDIEVYLSDAFVWVSADRVKILMDTPNTVKSYAAGLIDRLKAPITPGLNVIYNTTDIQKENYVRLVSLLYDLFGASLARKTELDCRNAILSKLSLVKLEEAHHFRMLANEIKGKIIDQWNIVSMPRKAKAHA